MENKDKTTRREFIAPDRRIFIKGSVAATGGAVLTGPFDMLSSCSVAIPVKNIRIKRVSSDFERKPLIRPFGYRRTIRNGCFTFSVHCKVYKN